MFKPVMDKISKTHPLYRFYGINVETTDGDEIATALKIKGIPTVVIFQKGQEVGRAVGAMDEKSFEKKVMSVYV